MRTRYADIESYQTKDGSFIKELMHPGTQHNKNQSLAEAIVPPGQITALHKHHETEEIYYITQGTGRMTLGAQQFDVQPGDSICITPGTAHCIENTASENLHILCCCSPAYSHEDTELL
ncbi:MAG: cupin domain-containing protein [Thioalkalispiraceae bacterium]